MYSQPRLLVFDLDGTLLDSKHELPTGVCTALRNLQSNGVLVTIATGRIPRSACRFLLSLGIEIPAIFYNGGLVASCDNEPVCEFRMDKTDAIAALELAKQYPVHPQLYLSPDDAHYYAGRVTDPLKEFSLKDKIPPRAVGDLIPYLEDTESDPMKLLIVGERKALVELRATFQRHRPTPHCVLSEKAYLEILPHGVNKGAALCRLCRYLDIPIDEVMAFGDNMNDREMLRVAGTGVAMATAPQEMLDDADVIIDNLSEFLGSLASTVSSKEGVS